MKLLLNQIRIADGTQARVEIRDDIVSEYAEIIESGKSFPAVKVFGLGDTYWLADGFHRYIAHQRCGISEIECDISEGGLRDAMFYSFGANADHGLRRTNDDKRKAVRAIIKDIEWSEMTVREIADVAKVSKSLVESVMKEFQVNKMEKKPDVKHEKPPKKENPTDAYKSKEQHKDEPKPVIEHFEQEDPIIEISTQLAEVSDENTKLKEMLALQVSDIDDSLKMDIQDQIDGYKQEIRRLEMENDALRKARDTYMSENAELKKQVLSYKAALKRKN